MAMDETKLGEFMNKVVSDVGAAMSGVLVVLGDRLGLYKAMAALGPTTPAELAKRTETAERYVREWLNAQAASGYVTYEPATGRYTLPSEQAFALAEEASPAFCPGLFQVTQAMWAADEKIAKNFRDGGGTEWGHHHACLFEGTERFFRSGYIGNLVSSWIPALDGMKDKLEKGARVADVGCGHGASTVLMAQAYPRSTFHGFDYHEESIACARRAAESAGVSARVTFEVASAKTFPKRGYDLVAFFDCLHDMGDPEGAARHVLSTLAPDGTWMIVEPFAHDSIEKNLNPVGRIFYSASTMICTPASKSQEVGLALGAQAGEKRLREVVTSGGFTRFRRATETPFNLILEARP